MSFEQRPRRHFKGQNYAGMSDVTIIVESPLKGSSMITAELASSYSREVMEFPNTIDKNGL